MIVNQVLPKLILASSSKPRAQLLSRLQVDFSICAPHIDETEQPSEAPKALVQRLAKEKAQAIAKVHPKAIIIGSDQVAVCEGQILGKPMTHENAIKQLNFLGGKTVYFHNGLCVLSPTKCQVQLITTKTSYRQLTAKQIEHYLNIEQPYHCAGSLKSEGLGITLCERIENDDPTALIGLPLIALINMLGKTEFVII